MAGHGREPLYALRMLPGAIYGSEFAGLLVKLGCITKKTHADRGSRSCGTVGKF